MKYAIQLFSGLIIMAVFASAAEAQIFKKIKKKAEKKLEDKVEQKIDAEMQKAVDNMVDNSWDTIFGDDVTNGQSEDSSTPFSKSSDVTTEDVYRFNIITTMKIRTENANGESDAPFYMDMHFNEGASYTGAKYRGNQIDNAKGDIFIVYDLKNSAMIMLMDSEEGKFSHSYGWKQTVKNAEPGSQEDVEWETAEEWEGYKKIGSKDIAGYSCDGYRLKNEGSSVEVWVTRENTYGMENLFGAHANAKQMKGKLPDNYPQGMLMEMISKDPESGEKVHMKVIDIRKNADVQFTMADYTNMSSNKK